jgi:hypothetical protein
MKLKKFGIPFFALLAMITLLVSCKDEWENHYNSKVLTRSDLNLYQYIESRDDLSKFRDMLKIVGYDSILTKTQTYTVWAPTNDALAGVDLSDTVLVKKLVNNHITRFSYTTSGVTSKTMLMFNKKLVVFAKGSNGYTFGDKLIVEPDLAMSNGIIHVLGQYAPYMKNIWEFINETDGLDSIRAFMKSVTYKTFDLEGSFKEGVFVDSVYKETNYILDTIAHLKVEDSLYTAILPDNNAWKTAYDQAFTYFNMLPKDGGIKAQVSNTRKAIINDLFFNGKYYTAQPKDSIYSTYFMNKFKNPTRLFDGAQMYEMSNGLSYVTSQLKADPKETWLQDIRIEAEDTYWGRITTNYTASRLSSVGTSFSVSRKSYLGLTDASLSSLSKLAVTFPLPGTLSGKYNIYCVFVPTKIVDANDTKPFKVKFYLSYVNSAKTQVNFAAIDANHKVLTPTSTAATFITNPNAVDEMLVAENFQFPYANLLDWRSQEFPKNISVVLKVENATPKTALEQVSYNRNLRIDCIILKPVQ